MRDNDKFPAEMICQGGTQNLRRDEFCVVCPYDKNHRALNHRISSHLNKCRTNYEVQKVQDGESPLIVSCRYNPFHKIYSPELLYHEHKCEDKKHPLVEPIYSENWKLLEAICRFDEEMELGDHNKAIKSLKAAAELKGAGACGQKQTKFEIDDEETRNAKVILAILKESGVPSSGGVGMSYSELDNLTKQLTKISKERCTTENGDNVLWPDPDILKQAGYDPATKYGDGVAGAHKISQTMDPESFGFRRRKLFIHKRYRLWEIKDDNPSDDNNEVNWDKDWWKSNASQKFDWLEHQYDVKGTSRLIPPGLTRAERKQFVIDNSLRLKFQEGIFHAEEDPKA